MRRINLIFTIISLPLDFLMIIGAGLAVMAVRQSPALQEWRPVLFQIPQGQYLLMIGYAAVAALVAFSLLGLYRIKKDYGFFSEVFRIFVGASAVLTGIAILMFLRSELFNSRFLVLGGWACAIVFVAFSRGMLRTLKAFLIARYEHLKHRVLIIGSDAISQNLHEFLRDEGPRDIAVVYALVAPNIAELSRAVGNPGVDEIILADPSFEREHILDIIDFCNERHIAFKFVPNLFQALTRNTGLEVIGGVPLVEIKRTPLEGWGAVWKRGIDIAGSLAGLVVFVPVIAAIAVAIKLESPGPVIFRDRRVGRKGEEFWTLKFRSMYLEYCTGSDYPNAETAEEIEARLVQERNVRGGPVPKVLNDPRRTRVGRFLERTSLDELPQFFNVLRGHMSLVGPRPHRPKEVAQYSKYYRKLFAVKPGITGLAQISGRSNLDFDDEARLDLHYIENWSPSSDFVILLKTPFIVLFRGHKS